MLTERRCKVPVPPDFTEELDQWKMKRMTIASTLIKMGDTENALRFIEQKMCNSSIVECIKLFLQVHDITSAKAICFHKFMHGPAPLPPSPLPQAASRSISPDDIEISRPKAWRLVAVAEATKDLDRVLQHGNLEEALREGGLNETLETIAAFDNPFTYINAISDIAGAIAEKGYETIAIEFAEKKLREKRIDIRRSPAYQRISDGLAKAGKFDRALALAPPKPPRGSGGPFSARWN